MKRDCAQSSRNRPKVTFISKFWKTRPPCALMKPSSTVAFRPATCNTPTCGKLIVPLWSTISRILISICPHARMINSSPGPTIWSAGTGTLFAGTLAGGFGWFRRTRAAFNLAFSAFNLATSDFNPCFALSALKSAVSFDERFPHPARHRHINKAMRVGFIAAQPTPPTGGAQT